MKKCFAFILVLLLVFSVASAETIFVSISDQNGNLALANEAVDVSDTDGDGVLTILDALTCAHDAAFEGGAAAGFSAEKTEYGFSMMMLWGQENGGSFGYYVNNASAYNMIDPVSEGDCVYAYAYTDLEAWSDTYSYFDMSAVEAAPGEAFTLTLNMQSYDADWNQVILPVEGAVITLDGAETEFTTDADGRVQINIDNAGEYTVSAKSESMTLVPPVCNVKII